MLFLSVPLFVFAFFVVFGLCVFVLFVSSLCCCLLLSGLRLPVCFGGVLLAAVSVVRACPRLFSSAAGPLESVRGRPYLSQVVAFSRNDLRPFRSRE